MTGLLWDITVGYTLSGKLSEGLCRPEGLYPNPCSRKELSCCLHTLEFTNFKYETQGHPYLHGVTQFHNQFSNIASLPQTSHLLSCQPGTPPSSLPQPHPAFDNNPWSVSELLSLDRDSIICYEALSVYFSLSRRPQASPPVVIFSTSTAV